MNIKKLLKRNLSLPLSSRVHVADIQTSVSIAKVRGDNAALFASIHKEIEPELKAKREVDRIYDRIGSVSGGHVGLKYHGSRGGKEGTVQPYTMGRETESNLAFENSPSFHIVSRVQELKEQGREEI